MAKASYVWDGTQFVSMNTPIAAYPNAVASYSSTAPSNPMIGTVWNDTVNSVLKVWSGSAWISYAPINNPTFTGNMSANNANFTGSLTANSGWSGTNSSAGILGGIPIAFTVERNGVGTANNQMSFGNGTTNVKGARMPFAGRLLAATLHGTNITGTITVDAFLNNSANSSYRLTGTATAADINITQNWQSSPLSFTAGSTLTWNQTAVPTSANGYIVTFFVEFD